MSLIDQAKAAYLQDLHHTETQIQQKFRDWLATVIDPTLPEDAITFSTYDRFYYYASQRLVAHIQGLSFVWDNEDDNPRLICECDKCHYIYYSAEPITSLAALGAAILELEKLDTCPVCDTRCSPIQSAGED